MKKQEIMILLDGKINEVFAELQAREGITEGDIDPMDAVALDDLTEKTAELILNVVNYQKRG